MTGLCPACREEVRFQLAGFRRLRCPACGAFFDADKVTHTDEDRS
jgi:transposase